MKKLEHKGMKIAVDDEGIRKKANAEMAKLVTVAPAKGDSVEHED